MSTLLFPEEAGEASYQPLAARLRPQTVAEFVGQAHLLGPGKSLCEAIASTGYPTP
jgi:putative ATPase|tara:strand:- start:605 stop:772 length:168 start_codon:yes stop_codon:yes gene_type:complete